MIMEFAWAIDDAIEIISDPNKWTRRATARTKGGTPVHACSPSAVCWCASGAFQSACSYRGILEYLHPNTPSPLTQAEKSVLHGSIPALAHVNDYEGRKRAIEELKNIRKKVLQAAKQEGTPVGR